jgi:ubiquitin carboxyl-terminal hydrolase 22/27/51
VYLQWLLLVSLRNTSLTFFLLLVHAGANDRFRIAAPVGMFNLGNTCFQSAILQCLVHCQPLQRYFMNQCGHHHLSCTVYREQIAAKKPKKEGSLIKTEGAPRPVPSICLACEMDRLFLMYYGSTVGKDIIGAMAEAAKPPLAKKDNAANDLFEEKIVVKGDPLILSDLLTAAWKSGGMDYLAGYDQRDAHEFLNSFLDLIGKHSRLHRERVYTSINTAKPDNSLVPKKEKAEHGEHR